MISKIEEQQHQRCGFIAIIGAPNAGKSTLLNTLVGTKVAIVSPKVQTTRCRVVGITIEGLSQLIFIDTPGIFRPKKRLERTIVAAAWQEVVNADLVALLVSAAARDPIASTQLILNQLATLAYRPVLLVLNKIDMLPHKHYLLALAKALNHKIQFIDTLMISALTGDGVNDLRRSLTKCVPLGPWLYPQDKITDMPLQLLTAEITREQLFLQLQHELPYALTVKTESLEELEDKSVCISQVIKVQRNSQKAIVLGHNGQMIGRVGTKSRFVLEALLKCRVHLNLFVKVQKDWIDNLSRDHS